MPLVLWSILPLLKRCYLLKIPEQLEGKESDTNQCVTLLPTNCQSTGNWQSSSTLAEICDAPVQKVDNKPNVAC